MNDSTAASSSIAEPAADLVLRAGSVDAQPADAAGRHPVRLLHDATIPTRGSAARAIRPRAQPEIVYPVALDAAGDVERRHAARGRRLRPVRQRQDGGQVQPREVHGGHHGDQQRPRPEPAHSHDHQHDADLDRHQQGLRRRTAIWRTPEKNGECAAMDNKTLGQEVFDRTYDPGFVDGLGRPAVQLEPGRVGAAGSGAARVGERRLLPQLVGQLVHRGQPDATRSPTTRRSASRRRSIRGCRAAAARSSAACTTSSRRKVGQVDELAHQLEELRRSRPRTGRAWTSASSRGCATGSRSRAARAPGAGSRTSCALRAVLPEQGTGTRGATTSIIGPAARRSNPYCREVEPYLTQFRGLATYTIPQGRRPGQRHVAQAIPGDDLAANFVANNAYITANATARAAISRRPPT